MTLTQNSILVHLPARTRQLVSFPGQLPKYYTAVSLYVVSALSYTWNHDLTACGLGDQAAICTQVPLCVPRACQCYDDLQYLFHKMVLELDLKKTIVPQNLTVHGNAIHSYRANNQSLRTLLCDIIRKTRTHGNT